MTAEAQLIHGSVFTHTGAGCLLIGPSGSGKSHLVADVISFGGKLVADDQVQLSVMAGMLAASPAPGLSGVLELRGYGLIKFHDTPQKQMIHLVVQLGAGEPERLPTPQTTEYLGIRLPLLHLPGVPRTSASNLLLYLKAMQEGRILPQDWAAKRA